MPWGDSLNDAQRGTLLHVAVAATWYSGIAETFRAFADPLLDGCAFEFAALAVVEADPRYLRLVNAYPSELAPAVAGASFRATRLGLPGLDEAEGGIEFLPAELGSEAGDLLATAGYGRGWCIALKVGGDFHGVLAVARKSAAPLDAPELEFLRRAASMLASAAHQEARLFQATRETDRARLLNDVAGLINSGEPLASIFQQLAAELPRRIAIDYFGLFHREGDSGPFAVAGESPALAGETPVAPVPEETLARIDAEGGLAEYRPERVPGAGDRLRSAGLRRGLDVVLHQGAERLGAITVARRTPFAFSATDRSFLRLLGGLLAQALSGARRAEAADLAAARARILNELALLLNAGEAVDALFDRLTTLLGQAIVFDYVSVFETIDEQRMRMVGSLPPLVRERNAIVSTADIAIADVLAAERPVVQFPIDAMTAAAGPALKALGFRYFASAPLRSHSEVLGLLSVARRSERGFSAEECAFLETVAALLAQSVANEKRLERVQTEAVRNGLLNEVAVLLNAGQPLETFLEHVREPLRTVIPFDRIALFAVTESGRHLEMFGSLTGRRPKPGRVMSFEEAGFNPRIGGGANVIQYRTAEMRTSKHVVQSGMVRGTTAFLRRDGELLGIFALGREDDTPFLAEELAFLELFATLLTQAVANRRQLQRAELEALRGGVLNRISLLLNSGRTADELWDELRTLLNDAIAHDFCSLVTRDDSPSGFRVRRTAELILEGEPVPFDSAGIATVASRGSHINQYETATGVLAPTLAMHAAGFKRAVSVNLHAGSTVQGLFTIARRNNVEFSPQEMAFVDVVGTLIGYAEANRRRIAESAAEAEEQRIIADAAAAAARESNEAELIGSMREPVGRFVSRPFVSFGFLEGEFTTFTDQNNARRVQPVLEFTRRAVATGQAWSDHYVDEANPLVGDQLREWGVHAGALTAADSGGTILGVLFVGSRDPEYRFDERALRLLRIFAQIIGPALANARAVARQQLEAEEQRIVGDVAAAAARESTPGALVQAVLHPLRQLVPRPYLAFGFIEGQELVYPRVDGSFTRWPFEEYTRRALVEGQISGPGSRLDRQTELAQWRPVATSMTTAVSAGTATGILLVASRQEGFEFDERHLRILRLVAQIVGTAMENARSAQRAKEDAAEQRVLAEVAAAAARETAPGVLVDAVRQPLRPIVPRPLVAFGFLEGGELVYPRADGSSARWPVGAVDRETLASGQVSGPAEGLDPATQLGAWGPTALARTVAMSGGNAIGILLTASREPDFVFEERHLRFLKLMAQIIGPAMENARAAERARDDAAEQRILADVAAAAARESDPDALLAAIAAPVRAIVPGALVAFSHRDGDDLIYSARGIGAPVRLPFGEWFIEAEARGQHVVEVTPDELGAYRAALWSTGQTIITTARSAGATTGFFSVTSRVPGFQADERQLRQLRLVAQVVGPAMESARAMAATARQEALYSLMFNSLSEGIILVDSNGNPVFTNELGRRIMRAIDPNDAAHSEDELAALLPRESREAYVNAMKHGIGGRLRGPLAVDGEETWLDYQFVPLDDPAMRLLVVATDVTADVRHEAEQVLHRDQIERASRLAALGEIVGGVAHELNNPLTAILGFTEILAMNAAGGPAADDLGIIQKEALRARDIVRDLLFVARPGASERALVPLAEVVDHIGRLRRAGCLRAGITFESAVAGECFAWGNQHQLTQVLLNLVTNAEQALADQPRKEVRISVESDGATTSLVVADTGVGMDAATRDRVFEPFFTTKQGQGTGLGLSLSYSIVRAHEGDLRVESAIGDGSRFILTLPARAPEESSVSESREGAAVNSARVLVVDDEPSLRKVCRRLLNSMGHECETAETSAAAIALAEAGDFDIVLCDYRLANETANDVIEGFLRVAPQLVARMVITTGATTDAGVVELTERYGLRLIAKPYGAADLAALIQGRR